MKFGVSVLCENGWASFWAFASLWQSRHRRWIWIWEFELFHYFLSGKISDDLRGNKASTFFSRGSRFSATQRYATQSPSTQEKYYLRNWGFYRGSSKPLNWKKTKSEFRFRPFFYFNFLDCSYSSSKINPLWSDPENWSGVMDLTFVAFETKSWSIWEKRISGTPSKVPLIFKSFARFQLTS